jgi:anaerobic selenocysteine-containing dehydrogenase
MQLMLLACPRSCGLTVNLLLNKVCETAVFFSGNAKVTDGDLCTEGQAVIQVQEQPSRKLSFKEQVIGASFPPSICYRII